MNILKKVIFSIFTIGFILVTLEITLRVASHFVYYKTSINDVQSEDAKSFRILTLGESTTSYGYFSDGIYAWPYLLEKLAKNQGYNILVYNTAVSAITSSHILDKLPEQMEKYNPDLIVSMMGINDVDNLNFKVTKSTNSAFLKRLKSLRVLKVKRWVFQFIKKKKQVINRNQKMNEMAEVLSPNFLLGKKLILKKYPREEIDDDLLNSVFWLLMPKDMRMETVDLRPLVFISDYALELFPDSAVTLENYFRIQNDVDTKNCSLFGINYLKSGKKLSPAADTLLTYCLRSEQALFPMYLKFVKNRIFTTNHNKDEQNPNYNLLIKETNLRNKKLVLMQYPTLPLNDLKRLINPALIKESNSLYFLENRKNFKKALIDNSFDEIFRDSFRQSWGHTTKLGHEVIARNVLKLLISKKLIRKE